MSKGLLHWALNFGRKSRAYIAIYLRCWVESIWGFSIGGEFAGFYKITCETGQETELNGFKSDNGCSKRQDKSKISNRYQQSEMSLPTYLRFGKFLKERSTQIFKGWAKASPYRELKQLVKKMRPSGSEFTLKELQRATNGFGEKIGKGGFGTVYLGTFSDGRKVAVKVFNEDEIRRQEYWMNELVIVTKLHHPSILNFLGYCFEDNLMLVYEYMEGGNLSDLLFGPEIKQIIDWPTRMKIILDIIRGIRYLHEGTNECMVHRDIKPSNILLDKDFNAKISDFGISRILPDDTQSAPLETCTDGGVSPTHLANLSTHVTTNTSGTMGYIDPECFETCRVTIKSDIYSFGMLLLNIVSGKKLIQQKDEGMHILSDHAWRLHKEDRLIELINPQLLGTEGLNPTRILRTITVALWCIQRESKIRPSTSQVFDMLSTEEEIPTPPLP
ncbi:probable serine/threonine-protein kinase PBL21 isoform X2 [Cryptomeria japonica]|uniref:probable serine/threonine-protein kinase PBL21 isoform X2 n=1 Tax=Cryptomeria japonica TaxID=3369 RepID=UPI0027DA1FE0|nr:probable serine/threonine-protein kinase PBL21 isoform X2 [Cryptomeria japonica]